MSFTRRAVIDVGTNSVKLLVAEVAGREIRPLCEQSQQTRLGQGFYVTHRLQPEAIANTAHAVARFAEEARQFKVEHLRVIATSAARDADNPDGLLAAIENSTDVKVEIVSGEQYADLAFQGVTTDPAMATRPVGPGVSPVAAAAYALSPTCISYTVVEAVSRSAVAASYPPCSRTS